MDKNSTPEHHDIRRVLKNMFMPDPRWIIFFLVFLSLFSLKASAENNRNPALSEGLEIEVMATQTSITAEADTPLFIHLVNVTKRPIEDISINVYLPKSLVIKWPDTPNQASRDSTSYRILKMQPFAHKTLRLLLTTEKRAPFESFNAIVQVRYTWFPYSKNPRTAESYRNIAMKSAPMEEISVSGLTMSFAIYIFPGLMALVMFGLFVPLPDTLKENRFLAGFLFSVGLLLLLESIGAYSTRRGICLGDLLEYTVFGALAGGISGFLIWRQRLKGRPLHERYPADPQMSLKELVVTYVRQTNSVKSAHRTIRVKQVKVFSAIIVETKQRDKILLPKKYELSGDPKRVERLKKAYDEGNPSRFAKLLSAFPGQLKVLDFIAEETTSGNWLSMVGGDKQKEINVGEVAEISSESESDLFKF
jgi:hypothetical protein